MYLISAYFDEHTTRRLKSNIDGIFRCTGNSFMIDHNVPPHLTLSAFETRDISSLYPVMDKLKVNLSPIDIHIVSVGVFFPYVIYSTPVLDEALHNMAFKIYDLITGIDEDVSINKYYNPAKWFPHITLAKTLSDEQMRKAFNYLQSSFVVLSGTVTEIGLAKTNPHEDLMRIKL